jgi:hypothetical protein
MSTYMALHLALFGVVWFGGFAALGMFLWKVTR